MLHTGFVSAAFFKANKNTPKQFICEKIPIYLKTYGAISLHSADAPNSNTAAEGTEKQQKRHSARNLSRKEKREPDGIRQHSSRVKCVSVSVLKSIWLKFKEGRKGAGSGGARSKDTRYVASGVCHKLTKTRGRWPYRSAGSMTSLRPPQASEVKYNLITELYDLNNVFPHVSVPLLTPTENHSN